MKVSQACICKSVNTGLFFKITSSHKFCQIQCTHACFCFLIQTDILPLSISTMNLTTLVAISNFKNSHVFAENFHWTGYRTTIGKLPAKSVQTASVSFSSPMASPSKMAWQESASTVRKSLRLLDLRRTCEWPSEWKWCAAGSSCLANSTAMEWPRPFSCW